MKDSPPSHLKTQNYFHLAVLLTMLFDSSFFIQSKLANQAANRT